MALLIDNANKALQMKLGGNVTTNQLQWSVSYTSVYFSCADANTSEINVENNGVSNNTTAVTMMPSPTPLVSQSDNSYNQLQFCSIYNSDTADATVTVQINTNSVITIVGTWTLMPGQTLQYDPGNGWTITPEIPFGTSSVVPIANTIFVAKNGNDTSALAAFTAAGNKGVLTKPFLTLAAARLAAISLTPSNVNRILIKVYSGYYAEQLVLYDFVDWDLMDSIIDLQAGSDLYTIDDLDGAADSIIYGNAQILRSTSGTGGSIRTTFPSTLKIYADKFTCSVGGGGSILCSDGTQVINGECESTSITNQTIVCNGTGNQTINGKCTSTGVLNNTIACQDDGIVTINGDCISEGATLIFSSTGTLTINGNCTSTDNIIGTSSGSGDIIINGNCNGLVDHENTGTWTINGNITEGGCVIQTGNLLIVNGSVYSSSGVAVDCGAGVTAAGTIIINGNVISDGDIAAECSGSGHTLIINGDVTSSIDIAVSVVNTTTTRINGRIVTTATNKDACKQQGASVLILDGCTLIANGTGKSIANGSTAILNTPCGGNKALGTATTLGCSLTIDSNIK